MDKEIERDAVNATLDASLFHNEPVHTVTQHKFNGGLPFSGDQLARIKANKS